MGTLHPRAGHLKDTMGLQAQDFAYASLGSSKLEYTRALTRFPTMLELSVILSRHPKRRG